MLTRVTERDGGLWIEIPDSFVKALNITDGQPLHIDLIDNKLIIKPDNNDACIVCEVLGGDRKTPNAETIEAIKAAQRGEVRETSTHELIKIWKSKMAGSVEELGDIVESTGEKWDAEC